MIPTQPIRYAARGAAHYAAGLWGRTTWQDLGLIWFVLTTGLTVLVLLLDLWLLRRYGHTISEYSRAHPWLAWILLTLQGSGNIGLAVHLMAPVMIEP